MIAGCLLASLQLAGWLVGWLADFSAGLLVIWFFNSLPSLFSASFPPLLVFLSLNGPPPPPSELSGYYRRGPFLPARASAQGSSQRIGFLCVFVSAVLPARALRFSIRTFVFAARALVVFFMNAVCPARTLASGTQDSILPARAPTDVFLCFLRLLLYRRGRSC